MTKYIDKDELVNVAMSVLLNAGDARNCIKQALDALLEENSDLTVDKKFEEAKSFINLAHKAQTDLIQREARGEGCQYSMLLTHAQDTLMTIKSEMVLAEQMVRLYRSLNNKINQVSDLL